MQWQVHGTHGQTGEAVVLTVEEMDAVQAVRAALQQQVIVRHVHRVRGMRWKLFPIVCGFVVALLAIAGGLYVQNAMLQENLAQTLSEQTRLAQAVAKAEQAAAYERHAQQAVVVPVEQVNALSEQLVAARSRMSLSQQQLSAAHQQLDALEQATTKIPQLQEQLTRANARLKEIDSLGEQMKDELVSQQRRVEELNTMKTGADASVVAKATELEKENRDLQAQLDVVKEQLLITAAQATFPVSKANDIPPEPAAAPTPARRPLRITFDVAHDFLGLHFDAESLSTVAAGEESLATTGIARENAVTMRFISDRGKAHVYNATLTVSLAADAPKDKLAENTKLVGEFVRAFAPDLKSPDAIAPAAGLLADQDSSRRLTFLGEQCKVDVWNSGNGTFTFKAEPAEGATAKE